VRGITPLVDASIAIQARLKKLQVSAMLTAILTSPDGADAFDGDPNPSLEPGAIIRIAYREAGKPTRFIRPVEDYWRIRLSRHQQQGDQARGYQTLPHRRKQRAIASSSCQRRPLSTSAPRRVGADT
jgi:hypothetical protein